jgi:hypothetical protein
VLRSALTQIILPGAHAGFVHQTVSPMDDEPGSAGAFRSLYLTGLRQGPDVGERLSRTALGVFDDSEIVEIQRVLGPGTTAEPALPAHVALALIAAPRICSRCIEPHGERRAKPVAGAPEFIGRPLELLGLGDALRHLMDVKHAGGEVVEAIEVLPLVDPGPPSFEDFRRRAQMDVGVDQRAPAIAGSLHGNDVVQIAEIVEALVDRPEPARQIRRLLVVGQAAIDALKTVALRIYRKIVRLEFPTTFEHADSLSGLHKARCGDSTGKPGADHNRIEYLTMLAIRQGSSFCRT